MKKVLASGVLTLTVLAAAMSAAPLSQAQAAGDAEKHALQARQGYMRLLALNIGPLGAMAKGEADYDADKASMHANNLAALAEVNLANVWLAGTDNEAMKGSTDALPKLFAEKEKVEEKADALAEATAEMADAAGGGLDALKAAIGKVGGACKSCHEDYRAKKN